ncbi:peptidase U32 family protein [Pseudobutyrivibrio sp. MD2005]|uniref:peptidase U32 family protein n=1 Tax=Pseudobutyrivibrio sp. MD2005 TaxID=1410616 RepID=UPI0004836316|nr:U32 family peptidase [Pseudobutyrivibrio sp. MD2005]
MNKLELLSPAGDLQIYKAVVNAGADAVYFGGDLFGARAYAKNFSMDDAKEAIEYGHLHGAQSYLTVNTLLKNPEIEDKLYDYLRTYVENGIDAFIVQDFGVFNFIRTFFPDTDIHVSTQASLCTPYGAKFFEDLGASRIVTAREISIEEIAKINKACPDLEIESFIHGALCVCYSGQCLMSSMLGGRSGNRGRCAQPCRLPYEAFDDKGKKLNKKGNYILSPKDFCTIEYLPQMIEAGVMSFKIEGRMKQLDYAAGVVSVYRHYLDQYLYKGANNYSVTEEDINRLLDLGNRCGFTSLYLKDKNGPEMITFEAPGHTKAESTKAEYPEQKIKVDCKVEACLGKEFTITFTDEKGNVGRCVSNVVEAAQNRATSKQDIEKAVSGLGNTVFAIDKLNISYDDNIFLPVSLIKNARRTAIQELSDSLLNLGEKRILPYEKIDKRYNEMQNARCFVAVLSKEQLNAVSKFSFVDAIAVPIKLFDDAKKLFDGKVFVYLPPILRDRFIADIKIDERADGVIACSYDELGLLSDMGYPKDKIILDHRLYTFNNRSLAGFEKEDYKYNCIPYELSLKELKHRDNHNSQMIIYSRIPMMITANCTVKNTVGCNKSNQVINLVDRKNVQSLVTCNCDYCYNTIYNSRKYIAFDLKKDILELGIKEVRIDFTVEDSKEVEQVLNAFEDSFLNDNPYHFTEDFTKGHLKRGVE